MHIYIHGCVFQVSTWDVMCALRSSRQYFYLWLCQVLVDLPSVYSVIAAMDPCPPLDKNCYDFIWKFLFAMPVGCLSMMG